MELIAFKCTAGITGRNDVVLDPVYRCYRDRDDPKRIWCVIDNVPNKADHVFSGYPFDTGSRGYGGRWLVFPTVDGTTISLQGPFHTNADSLYKATGIDVRNTHLVQFVVGKTRQNVNSSWIITDIVYSSDPHLDVYEYEDKLVELYEQHKCPLYFWHGGSGGSCSGMFSEQDYERKTSSR